MVGWSSKQAALLRGEICWKRERVKTESHGVLPTPIFEQKDYFNQWGKLLQIHLDYHLRQFTA